MQRHMSSTDVLKMQQKMIAFWPGRPIDDLGLFRVLNEHGSRPPIFWICNAGHEPKQLASAFGEDQPFYFTRSTHLLLMPDADPAKPIATLAHYIFDQFSQDNCFIRFDAGATCQGAALLRKLCNMLDNSPFDIGSLCIINGQVNSIFADRPALLVYGDEDQMHDPFVHDFQKTHERAVVAFSSYQRLIVKSEHGNYHRPEILSEIVTHFDALRRSSRQPVNSSTVG